MRSLSFIALTLLSTGAFAAPRGFTTRCESPLMSGNTVIARVPAGVTFRVQAVQGRWNLVQHRGVLGWVDSTQSHCGKVSSTSQRGARYECEPGEIEKYYDPEVIGESGGYWMYKVCMYSAEDGYYTWVTSNLSPYASDFKGSE